jgi:Na+/H+ antiporter NhaD/arsenite permease-like protein
VEGISDEPNYALVAGAVTGGGLTVIANAPNPAGGGILQDANAFGDGGISPLGLFLGALLPTLVAVVFSWLLRVIHPGDDAARFQDDHRL